MKIAPKIVLTDDERTTLERWSRGRNTATRLVLRAKIVLLACSLGLRSSCMHAIWSTASAGVATWPS